MFALELSNIFIRLAIHIERQRERVIDSIILRCFFLGLIILYSRVNIQPITIYFGHSQTNKIFFFDYKVAKILKLSQKLQCLI